MGIRKRIVYLVQYSLITVQDYNIINSSCFLLQHPDSLVHENVPTPVQLVQHPYEAVCLLGCVISLILGSEVAVQQ